MHYHCSKLYTVYKRDIIQVVVGSRVSCTTTVQNYTLSTSATLYRWLFGAVLVALPLFKTIHCLQARHYKLVVWGGAICTTTFQNHTLSTKRNIIQVVVWSRVTCTTTVQNYTLPTSATLYGWLFGAVLVALPLFKTTLSTSATLYRWLLGAVLVALPLFKTIHCLQARHYTVGCLGRCYLHYHFSKLYTVFKRDIIRVVVWSRVSCTTTVQNYTVYKRDIIQVVVWSRVSCNTTVQNYALSTGATLYRWLFGAVLVALPLFKTIHGLQRGMIQVVVWSRVSCTTVQNYTLPTSATLYRRLFGAVLVALPLFKTTLSTNATLYRWLFGAVLVAIPLFKTIHCLQARHYTGGFLEPY